MASTILFKRSNTAGNDAYTGSLGEITIDTQARKVRVHDSVKAGGFTVANMDDIQDVIDIVNLLGIDDIDGLRVALTSIENDVSDLQLYKANKQTIITAGNGLTGGGDLAANRTITLGTPEQITGATIDAVTATGHSHSINITKADVGLGSVDNTSDAGKPVSILQQDALDLKIDATEKGAALGVATLDANAKIPASQLSDSLIGQVIYQGTWNAATNNPVLPKIPEVKGQYYVVATAGDFVIDADGATGTTATKTISFQVGDWIISNGVVWEKVDNTDAVTSVAGRTGNILLTQNDVGLDLVDNTADLDKPVSVPTQGALDLKANIASPGFTGTPLAPTAIKGTNTTQIATTAFVISEINDLNAGTVNTVTGSAPITVDTVDPENPVVSITAATQLTEGSMSSADKTKLDNIEVGAQVNDVRSVNTRTGDVVITKTDVNLGSVQNYGMSDEASAVTGTSLVKYTSPQRVRDFVEKGTYTIDGGTF